MQRVEKIVTTFIQTVESSAGELSVSNERILVEAARKGDTHAFEDLINATSKMVFSLIGRMLDDPHSVEDLAQNSYLKAWTNISDFRGQSRFATWIYRIALNETISHIRKETRKRANEPANDETISYMASKRREQNEIIDKLTVSEALKELPLQFRTAISLSYLKGLSYEESAEIMNVPLNTYRTLVYRAKVRLRKVIEGEKT